MKNYPNLEEQARKVAQRKYVELKLFQSLLRECAYMNARLHGKAHAIADGLQAWIDALDESLK